MYVVKDRVPETRFLGFGSAMEKWVLGKVEQFLCSMFAKFLASFDDLSKRSMPEALKNFEKSSNMPKNLTKNEERQ